MESWLKTGFVIVAMAAVGFLGSWEASGLVSPRGGIGPTILQAQSPLSAILSVVVTIGVASVVGGFVARITTAISGMIVLGFSIFAMAMKLEGIEGFIYGSGNLYLLMIEVLFISILLLLGTYIVFAIGGPFVVMKKDSFSITTIGWPVPFVVEKEKEGNKADIWKALLISAAILPVVYLVAKSPMRGQAIGAAAVGGIAIGFLARRFTPSMQPHVYYVFPTALAALGYLFGTLFFPVSDVAFAQQHVSPLLFPMPIEYAAGLLLGVSLGLSWGISEDKLRVEFQLT